MFIFKISIAKKEVKIWCFRALYMVCLRVHLLLGEVEVASKRDDARTCWFILRGGVLAVEFLKEA